MVGEIKEKEDQQKSRIVMGGKVLKLWERKEMFQAIKQYEQWQELRNWD